MSVDQLCFHVFAMGTLQYRQNWKSQHCKPVIMKPDNFFSVQCFYFRLSFVTVSWQNRFFFFRGDEFVTYFRVSFLGPFPEPSHARWMAFAENSSSAIWCWNTLILDPSPFLLFRSKWQNQSKSFLCLKLLRCLLDRYVSHILWQQGMSDECDMLCFLLGKAGSISGLVILAVSVWFFQQMASICWSSILCFERHNPWLILWCRATL